jgi:hypothetical protein
MSEIVSSENKYSDHKKSYYSLSYSFSDDPDDTYTIVDIIREKEFYNLLFQLNADIIKEYNVVNKEDNYKENVLVTIDIGNDDPDGGEIFDEGEEMKLKMVTETNIISKNVAELNSIKCSQDKCTEDDTVVVIDDVNIIFNRNNGVVKLDIKYSVEYETFEYMKEFINMFIKKLFHRLVTYFDDSLCA